MCAALAVFFFTETAVMTPDLEDRDGGRHELGGGCGGVDGDKL
jgi:hypothetical protein